jgi:hypothetical protein
MDRVLIAVYFRHIPMNRLGLLLLLLLPAGTQRTSAGLASVEGIVVRAGTDTPVSGATVELTGIAPRTVEGSSATERGVISVNVREAETDGSVLSYTATTRRDGTFEIRNIRPGSGYQLIALHYPDYLPAQYGQRVATVPGRSITVASGDQLKDLRIEMTPGGTISGVVVDSRGQGVRNVQVELRRPWYLEGWRLLVEWNELVGRLQGVGKSNRAGMARTNERGEFSFSGLAPAQYYVRTSFADESSLKPVNLRAGGIVDDVRIAAPDSEPRWVTGAVLDTDGSPLASGQVIVSRRDAVPIYQKARIAGGPIENGVFQLPLPGAGKYVLTAVASGNSSAPRGRREIEIRDVDLRNVRVVLTDAFNIGGSVSFEGTLPAATSSGDMLSLSLYPMAADLPSTPSVRLPMVNAAFTVQRVMAGDYRVEVLPILTVPPSSLLPSAFDNVFVKSVTLDGKDILNDGLHLEAAPRRNLEVVISTNGGIVEGRVLDTDATPRANVKTVAVPSGPRRRRGDLYKYVSTDDEGRFRLTGLAPGDYKLFAFERVEEGAWEDPEFIRLFEDRGTTVRVEEGRRSMVEIRITPVWN